MKRPVVSAGVQRTRSVGRRSGHDTDKCSRDNNSSTYRSQPIVGEFRKCPEFSSLLSLIPFRPCATFSLFFACDRHHHPAWSTRWPPLRCCRVRLDATSSPDSESWSEACAQPSGLGSNHCGFVYLVNAPGARFAVGCRLRDLDSAAFSQNADQTEVPAAVFTQTSPSAGSQRTDERTDRRRR